MKTLLTGLVVLGLTIQSLAQNSPMKTEELKLDKLELAPSKNVSYLNTVISNETSIKVRNLETEVSTFDITKSKVFENNFDTYQMMFSNVHGKIVATYDSDGKLINAFEKFVNVPLPEIIRNAIKNEYPGWTINSTVYRVNYYNENDIIKVYNIKIVNQNKKLNLKVNPQGQILNKKKILK